MAIVGVVTVTIIDAKERLSNIQYFVDIGGEYDSIFQPSVGLDVGDTPLEDWVRRTLESLDRIITGKIVSINLSIKLRMPAGLKTAALTDSDVEEKGYFAMQTLTSNLPQIRQAIPTFDHDLFENGVSVSINETDNDDLIDYLYMLTNPNLAALWADYGGVTDSRGNRTRQFTGSVYKKFTRSRK